MSRRHNLELAGVSTPSDLRQELINEIAVLEQEQLQHERLMQRRHNPDHRIENPNEHEDEPEIDFRRNRIMKRLDSIVEENNAKSVNRECNNKNDETQQQQFSPSRRAIAGGLCLEGALADTELSQAQRMIAREEAMLKLNEKTQRQKQRFIDQLKTTEERADWAMKLIFNQERESRETVELLAGSQFVETERKERATKQRAKVDAEVEEYLVERQVIDDLHNSMVEDRWLTRDQVLKEAAAFREAREQVERDWRREKETVFLDEEDVFLTMN